MHNLSNSVSSSVLNVLKLCNCDTFKSAMEYKKYNSFKPIKNSVMALK